MKRFVIGDIHGAHRALVQCFERSGFNKQEDLLISLGDLCDGWPDVYQVFEELLSVKHLVLLLGNHDQWMLNWMNTGDAPDIWLSQGGYATINSYKTVVPATHKELLNRAILYYIIDNMLFVHGGFIPDVPLEHQDKNVLLWDRSLVKKALLRKQLNSDDKLTTFDKVYIGHTPTINFGETSPIEACDICLMDTGAGWPGGVLTMRDFNTGRYWQSDQVDILYPDFRGR